MIGVIIFEKTGESSQDKSDRWEIQIKKSLYDTIVPIRKQIAFDIFLGMKDQAVSFLLVTFGGESVT